MSCSRKNVDCVKSPYYMDLIPQAWMNSRSIPSGWFAQRPHHIITAFCIFYRVIDEMNISQKGDFKTTEGQVIGVALTSIPDYESVRKSKNIETSRTAEDRWVSSYESDWWRSTSRRKPVIVSQVNKWMSRRSEKRNGKRRQQRP